MIRKPRVLGGRIGDGVLKRFRRSASFFRDKLDERGRNDTHWCVGGPKQRLLRMRFANSTMPAEGGAFVPSLWRLEVANALLMAERRGRILATTRTSVLADLRVLPIAIDPETESRA